MTKRIEINSFQFIETTDQTVIDKAIADGLTVTDIIPNPNNYLADGSDRPEFISQATRDAIKANQDLINDTENKPRIILALDELPYHERTKAQYDTFSYEILSDYFTLMVSKQNLIAEIVELKYDDSVAIDEVKQIQSDIKLKQKTIERIDLALIENPGLQSLLDHKVTLESEITTLQSELSTKASAIRTLIKSHWDIEGAKTSTDLKTEIQTIKDSQGV